MNSTLPQRDPHLNEAPKANPVFDCITVGRKPKDYKSLITTLTNGLNLLSEGYIFARTSDVRYTVESPKGEKYDIRFDPGNGVASCSCPACVRLGVCKHLVCLDLNQDAIDVQIAKRELAARHQAEARAQYERTLQSRAGYWEGTEAFFRMVDAAAIVAAVA